MVKIFDMHADLGLMLAKRKQPDQKAYFREVNLPEWQANGVGWTAAASFFRGGEDWEYMKQIVLGVKRDIAESGLKQILTTADLCEDDDCTTLLMTIEGMCGIRKDPEESVRWLYDQGNRIGSLCWNDQNALATGNSGDPGRGLTAMGRTVIRTMNDLHMIVDVSHANEHTFWDILDASELPIVATHSNAKKLCFVERNLTDQQIRAIAGGGGLIGMNACCVFIDADPAKRDALHLARHAAYIAEKVGVEHVACGFDFGSYYEDEDDHTEMFGPTGVPPFIAGLREVGFSETEVKAIAYQNLFDFLRKYM